MTVWNLAIECSAIGGSVVLSCDGAEEIAKTLPGDGGSVQFLAPAIRELVAQADISRPDFLSVTVGPGSFTGLRVGIVTAKMLGYVWQIPIVPVDTLHAIAYEAVQDSDGVSRIIPVINAFRKQVFSGVWRYQAKRLAAETDSMVVDAKAWIEQPFSALGSSPEKEANQVLVAGPGLETFQPSPSLGFLLRPGGPHASAVAKVGWDGFRTQQSVEADKLLPNYVRQSAAEETHKKKAAQ